jgi:anaerobic magnesium-protoporphyrin IX monomethyl ester cyclase
MADVTVVNSIHSHDPRVPLGPLYLSSFLEAHGYEVDFRDYQVCDNGDVGTPEQFTSWLSGSARVLAVSTLSSSLPLVLSSLSRRQFRNQIETVVLGGPGVSNLGPQILQSFSGVDVVVCGEGEQTLLEVIRELDDGGSLDNVPGVSYRHGRGIRQNPPRDRINDLDQLPFPAYHHVDLKDYTERTDFDRIPLAVLSARGCPYACTFCDIPGIWRGGIRYRSVSNVIRELEVLKANHGIPRFHVADDTFVYEKERVLEFCRLLKAHGLNMPWSCLGRVDRMDEQLLYHLSDANCDTIFYGIESGSDEVLEKINKRFTAAEALDVVQQSLQYMKVHVSLMWGFPFESIDDLYDTVVTLLAMHHMGAEPHLNLLVPLPSAEITSSFPKQRSGKKAWEVGWDWAMMENYEYGDELHDLIARYPDIFAPFYCLESPDFDRKVALLESWGLGLGGPRPPRATSPHASFGEISETDESQLPEIAEQIKLRCIGDRKFILDASDCLLYEPSPRYVELFQACQCRDRFGRVVEALSATSAKSPQETREFVIKVLSKFSERGFLAERPQQ